MYVNYEYYTNVYAGEVTAEAFTKLELKASSVVNYYTFNRILDLPLITDDIKLAVCELVDHLENRRVVDSEKEIQSETVGTYSVTYAISKYKDKNTNMIKKEQKAIVYISSTSI